MVAVQPNVTTERIGIYGGTFDPVHSGHLILARDAVELLGLSRMIFVPAALSPHKLGRAPGARGEVRLEMLRAAVAGETIFEVDPCELGRAGPSYTIDTIHTLRARLPGAELHYLIGADNVPELHTWHRIDELRALVTFVVFRRRLFDAPVPGTGTFPSLDRVLDLSSTEIRNRVASGRSIRYLVPETVAAVIDAHGLYRNPPRREEPSHYRRRNRPGVCVLRRRKESREHHRARPARDLDRHGLLPHLLGHERAAPQGDCR